jgi:hypothetical protein
MAGPHSLPPALYRVYQFLLAVKANLPVWAGGVTPALAEAEARLLAQVLPTPAQQALFQGMPANDQRHALAVAHSLSRSGYQGQLALLQAALLHDVAKSMGQPLPHRVLIVLLTAFWPTALVRLATTEASLEQVPAWRRPFVIHARHPALGAAWARQAGCDPLAVRLIARHQAPRPTGSSQAEDRLLLALQVADDAN